MSERLSRALGGSRNPDADRQVIADLVAKWVVWRDSGDWERFRTIWHLDGVMEATWTNGTVDDFIEANRAGWDRGVRILHFLGGGAVDVAGDRAIAETKMTISQRAEVEGVECDVICTGRFYDFFERRAGRWGLVLRQPIYEKDRIDAVDPEAVLQLDRARLAAFPVGYRHLAYLQSAIGYPVRAHMPGIEGAEVIDLYARGKAWMAGAPLAALGKD